jgi:hypothetical protein
MNISEELNSFDTPSARLRQLFLSEKSKLHLSLLAKHPSTPQEILLQLGEHYPIELLHNPIFPLLLLETPDAALSWPEKTVQALLSCAQVPRMMLEVALHHTSAPVRKSVASSPSATLEMLRFLCDDAHAMVVIGVAENRKTPPEILERISRHKGQYVRLEVAKNPNTSAEMLHRLARDEEWLVRHQVAVHPNTRTESLSLLVADRMAEVRAAVAARSDAPRALVTLITQLEGDSEHPLSVAQEEELFLAGEYGGRLLSRRAGTTGPRLLAILKMWPWLGLQVSAHPAASPEALALSASRYDTPSRLQVAVHPNTSREVLASLVSDKEPEIRRVALRHPAAPQELITLLQRAGADSFLQEHGAPQPLTPDEFHRLFAAESFAQELLVHHPEAPPELLLALVKKRELLDEIASHPRASYEALEEVKDYSPKQVAQHPHAGSLLEHLAGHRLRGVRHAVAKNPVTPESVLVMLAKDTCREVRYAVAKHPALGVDWCVQLSLDADWLLRRAAARHASTPVVVLARLCRDSDLRVRRSALALHKKKEKSC